MTRRSLTGIPRSGAERSPKDPDPPIRRLDQAPEVLTFEEAKQVLQLGRNRLYDLIHAGTIATLPGRRILIPKSAITRFLSRCTTSAERDHEDAIL